MELLELKKVLQDLDMTNSAREGFFRLYSRMQSEKPSVGKWESLRSPDPEKLPRRDSLPTPSEDQSRETLTKLAVCKLNGGLGTSMGCPGPKSLIPVRENQTFLDLIVGQLRFIKEQWKEELPLFLMNSFYTEAATREKIARIEKYASLQAFQQNRYPRLELETQRPLSNPEYGDEAWYPPGHGDVYACLQEQGILDRLLNEGREVLFISNADNLGAEVDPTIAHYMLDQDIPFIMETTPKTLSDVKGGTLVEDSEGQLRLLELAQVPQKHVEDFCDTRKFKIFNTNNIWVHLKHLKSKLEEGPMDLALILNQKEVRGRQVLQLETAIGAGMDHFKGAIGLVVERSRFLPVKNTSDLLMIQSDLFHLQNSSLVRNPARTDPALPQIQWKPPLDQLEEFHRRIPVPPSLIGLEKLEIEGDVRFQGAATLEGKVKLDGTRQALEIEEGAILKDQTITQN